MRSVYVTVVRTNYNKDKIIKFIAIKTKTGITRYLWVAEKIERGEGRGVYRIFGGKT
jgi:hypothetical protein